jgi:uncharacterized protein (TIGR04255 family)
VGRETDVSFEPKKREHAIVESVCGLLLTRNLIPAEIEALVAAHDQWRDDLPRLARTGVFQIVVGDGGATQTLVPPGGGVSFDRVNPDGTLDWRLRADDAALFVNCLSYTGWAEVWPRTRRYLQQACDVAVRPENMLRGAIMEYIDVFEWVDEAERYELDLLFDRDSAYVPNSVWGKGALWHLHQGWFRTDNLPVKGRMLERIHLDGVIDDTSHRPTVRMSTYLSLEFESPIGHHDFFEAARGLADGIFGELHRLNKGLVGNYITKDMATRIKLNA